MSAKGRLSRAEEAARAARSNQYLQRLIEDEGLRSNLMSAYGSARSAYARMSNGKPAGRALLEDRKLQRELGDAVTALRDASFQLREPPRRRRRRRGLRRLLLVAVVGGALALAFNEGLRSKVLDMMFGAEEEFDYSSTTAPATPAPTPVSG
jgi:ferric-dicitrate binding protein FerR (iron transport regulator)